MGKPALGALALCLALAGPAVAGPPAVDAASVTLEEAIVLALESAPKLQEARAKVALARLASTTLVELAGAHGGQIFLVQRRLLVTLHHPRRAQQFGSALIVGHVGETAIEFEFQLAFAAAHPAPAIEENAGNDNDADDDQPLAQTDIHVFL